MTDPVAELTQRARAAQAQAPVPSPCISICRMDAASGWCEGCLRNIEEITAWSRLEDEGKRAVWRRIAERAQARGTP